MNKRLVLIATLLLLSAFGLSQTPPADLTYDVAPWPIRGHRPQPEYPDLPVRAGVPGKVRARVTVDDKGRVTTTQIVTEKPSELGFGQAVESALQCWQFEPALKNSQPVCSSTEYEFWFYGANRQRGFLPNEAWSKIAKTVTERPSRDPVATYQPPPIIHIYPRIVYQ